MFKRILFSLLTVALAIFTAAFPNHSSAANENVKLGFVHSVLGDVGLVSTADGSLYLIKDLWINLYDKREIRLVSKGTFFGGIGDKIVYLNYDLSRVEHESTLFTVKEVVPPSQVIQAPTTGAPVQQQVPKSDPVEQALTEENSLFPTPCDALVSEYEKKTNTKVRGFYARSVICAKPVDKSSQ
ncbi:hypothetical protein ACFLFF_27035 [Brevibacillus reuszeri]|uniref:hypothetical protein n=1 Tax=Brevibacillus reuszeri TaxID=54915 RepID=UPI00366BD771